MVIHRTGEGKHYKEFWDILRVDVLLALPVQNQLLVLGVRGGRLPSKLFFPWEKSHRSLPFFRQFLIRPSSLLLVSTFSVCPTLDSRLVSVFYWDGLFLPSSPTTRPTSCYLWHSRRCCKFIFSRIKKVRSGGLWCHTNDMTNRETCEVQRWEFIMCRLVYMEKDMWVEPHGWSNKHTQRIRPLPSYARYLICNLFLLNDKTRAK